MKDIFHYLKSVQTHIVTITFYVRDLRQLHYLVIRRY